jgi:hypothetical protein
MTINNERIEELRNKLLIRLRSELDEFLHDIINKAGNDPLKFLFNYIKDLKKDTRGSIGNSSSDSYVYIDFPLSRWDFTEEELKYLGFYDKN